MIALSWPWVGPRSLELAETAGQIYAAFTRPGGVLELVGNDRYASARVRERAEADRQALGALLDKVRCLRDGITGTQP